MDRTQVRVNAFHRKRRRFGEDVCDLIGPTFTEGGSAGDSIGMNPVATNLACFIEELASGAAQTVVGGEAYLSSHSLQMESSAASLAITPRYQIKVHARDARPERVFEKPIIADESFIPLVTIKATLVKQGYQ